ncbi:MAG: AAA family ATPase [Pseudobdellovibrionaceae bacterium]|nr:AAA family ATPase [Pseudobdellovibrionaceae bacterium]
MTGLLVPGQKLRGGTIEVIDKVGSGGAGEVYRVSVAKDGHREVMILKCFDPKKVSKEDFEIIEMVHRESTAVSKIDHPGIVKIHSIDLDVNHAFIVEEYLKGGDLQQFIVSRGKLRSERRSLLSPLEIAEIGLQISSALVTIHQNNLYHGDLKPQNICLRGTEPIEAVIVDFGHSGFVEGNILNRNEQLATLAYLPPERTGFVKLAGSASSDLYSLGATLYEAALGGPAFSHEDGKDLVNRLLYEIPKPLHEIFPDFPLTLSDIIAKLLRKDPRDRYNSAFGLSIDLERCLMSLQQTGQVPPFALGTKDKLRELNYRVPLVGREQEMHTLHRLFDEVVVDGSSMALIGAPSGTGKSRLAFEVLHRARERQALISYVKFSEYERNLPLSAVTLLLLDHFQYMKSIEPARLKQWQTKISVCLGSRLNLIADRYSFYADYFPSDEKGRIREEELDLQEFNHALGEFLSLLPARGEIQLVLIDDLQWADWQSLQVFAALAKKIASKEAGCIMFLGTYRSNEITENHPLVSSLLSMKNQITLMELGPLARADANILMEHLLDEKGKEVEKLQDICYRLTLGNPFFIYEYLKASIRSGIYALDEKSQSWQFHEDRISSQNLSNGVAGLVAERIQSLASTQQVFVCIASIAGHSIKRTALLHLLPLLTRSRNLYGDQLQAKNLDQTMEMCYQELVQKNILNPDADRFTFFHDKIQEACYSLLNEQEKCLLHSHFGYWAVDEIKRSAHKVDDAALFEAAFHVCRGQRTDLPVFVRQFLMTAAQAAKRVFAYDKVKEYLQFLSNALESMREPDQNEKFDVLEMLADTLVISEQIHAAMQIYDQLLGMDREPIRKAHIYVRKVEFCLNLFEYKQARDACSAALEVLGVKIFTTELKSYIYILLIAPFFTIYCLYFKFFGRQHRELTSEYERVRLLLLLKNEISQYFTQPIVAIANIIPLTFELLKYKDNEFRATLFCYWGCALSAFGVKNISNRFFIRAYEYFDKNPSPVDKGFVLFAWGYVSDLARGDLITAQKKFEDALFNLEPIGESFWRSLATLGLLVLDYFGIESGQAAIRSHELVGLWQKVGYAATPLGCTLRHHLEVHNEDRCAFVVGELIKADRYIQTQGYDSVDSLVACVGLGEYFDYKEEYAAAEEYAKRAFFIAFTRAHRISYNALFPPIIYARVLTKKKKLAKSFGVLAYCWFNQLLDVKVFRPHTCYETGRWFNAIGFPRLGRFWVESGIKFAGKRRWLTPLAEGRLLWAQLFAPIDAELASAYLRMSQEYFQQRLWKFHEVKSSFATVLCIFYVILWTTACNHRPKG